MSEITTVVESMVSRGWKALLTPDMRVYMVYDVQRMPETNCLHGFVFDYARNKGWWVWLRYSKARGIEYFRDNFHCARAPRVPLRQVLDYKGVSVLPGYRQRSLSSFGPTVQWLIKDVLMEGL